MPIERTHSRGGRALVIMFSDLPAAAASPRVSTSVSAVELSELRDRYDDRVSSIEATRSAAIKAAAKNYVKALNRELDKAKSRGELEEVLSLKKEIERIKNAASGD